MVETTLYIPDPPPTLNATPEDVATLEKFVKRFGWDEFMWHVGQIIVKGHNEATGTRKKALRGLANHVNFVVPGVFWCCEELNIHRNQMTLAEKRDATKAVVLHAAYKYDVFGNRIEKAVDWDGDGPNATVVTRYVLDGWNNMKPIGNEHFDIHAELDDSNQLIARYLHGDEFDQTFARVVVDGTTPEVHWLLTDHLYSVRLVLDESGAALDQIAYDAFGNIVAQLNLLLANLVLFASRGFDAETGLYYNRARYLDPITGGWTTQDPLGSAAGDANLYRYVGNRATLSTDPSGYLEQPPLWARFVNSWDTVLGNQHTGWFAQTSNFFAGWGDTLSFGATSYIRWGLGYDDVVDYHSGAYFGGQVVGTVHGIAMMRAGPGVNIGRQGFSRLFWDPRSWGRVRAVWSGTPPTLRANGLALHHVIFPQRWTWIPQGLRNAGFNYMPMSAWRNSVTLNRFAPVRPFEWAYRFG